MSPRQMIPSADDDLLLTSSATELAARIRRGAASSAEVVLAHIRHARRVNPSINAIVVDRYAAVVQEAVATDRAFAAMTPAERTALPPLQSALWGVPCTIKECFALTGMPQTSGLVARAERGVVAGEDAPSVARLRAAGALPLGVTNVSELCMWMEANNHVYGRTSNPYDLRRIVGGSSGGEGAIVASGASPFGLGSDIGGSIRLPAFFNGVFGHKPSPGLVPNDGQYPVAEADGARLLATGPLARRAEDLWPLLRVLSAAAPALGSRTPQDVDLSGLRVVIVERPGVRDLHPDQRNALRRVADALPRFGIDVRTAELPALRRAFLLWSDRLATAGEAPFHELLGEGTPPPLARELLRWMLRRSAHTLPALALALLEKLPMQGTDGGARTKAALLELRGEIDRVLGPNGVLVQATFPRPAPRHNLPILSPQSAGYTAIFNALELPVTAAPTGLSPTGLPTGVQIAGRPGDDVLTIAVALALEQALGGWVPPWKAPRVR